MVKCFTIHIVFAEFKIVERNMFDVYNTDINDQHCRTNADTLIGELSVWESKHKQPAVGNYIDKDYMCVLGGKWYIRML